MVTVVLALVDAAAGGYLVRYALRREQRDKDAVLAVGVFLLVCAAVLVGLELLLDDGQLIEPRPPARQV